MVAFGYIALILSISLPSMIIAAIKLRKRNIGPLLDANGWAVNALTVVNIPFGKRLTKTLVTPPFSNVKDPFEKPKYNALKLFVAVVIILGISLFSAWYFGLINKVLPDVLPNSSWVQAKLDAEAKAANSALEAKAVPTPDVKPAATQEEKPAQQK